MTPFPFVLYWRLVKTSWRVTYKTKTYEETCCAQKRITHTHTHTYTPRVYWSHSSYPPAPGTSQPVRPGTVAATLAASSILFTAVTPRLRPPHKNGNFEHRRRRRSSHPQSRTPWLPQHPLRQVLFAIFLRRTEDVRKTSCGIIVGKATKYAPAGLL